MKPTDEQIYRARSLLKVGMRAIDIAKLLGLSKKKVYEIRCGRLKPRASYSRRNCSKPVRDRIRREVQLMLAVGRSVAEIAVEFGVCAATIRRIRNELDEEAARSTVPESKPEPLPDPLPEPLPEPLPIRATTTCRFASGQCSRRGWPMVGGLCVVHAALEARGFLP